MACSKLTSSKACDGTIWMSVDALNISFARLLISMLLFMAHAEGLCDFGTLGHVQ